jgi:hypothetical protein
METLVFNEVLEAVEALPPERQQTLVEIMRLRLGERRREEIRRNAELAREQFVAGQLPRGTVEDLLRDLLTEEPV